MCCLELIENPFGPKAGWTCDSVLD